ncbi:hypothetical protein ANCDUO_27315 [Ancylostoma duodenale]|uniref:MKRN2 opposite strand protein-like C-terminal domain-containing protein n=1 Tax=Ancylostoma duodenale TaxID=51022 RepID=A0A0C2FCC2_9BILA|nr:hypothetical protein ANCDUO_27315 [Ancylostoma duodenale]
MFRYESGDDLHIGISDSRSVVHSFWLSGISAESTNWGGSMVICRFDNDCNEFDRSLSSFISCSSDRFLGQLYEDTRWNCFDFVIEFMRFTNYRNFTKIAFVSEFMQKALNNAIRYSILVRKVMEGGVFLL